MLNTLRGKFIVLIFLPVLVALIGLVGNGYFSARHYLLKELEKEGLDALKADAEHLRTNIIKHRMVLESLAVAHHYGQFSDAQRTKMFVTLHETLGDQVNSVFMGFPDGRIVRSTTFFLPENYDPKTRPWYREAISLPAEQDYGITEPYLDAATLQTVITAFRRVKGPDGGVIGVLGLDLDFDTMVKSLEDYAGLHPNGIGIQVTDDARIRVHPDSALIDTYLDDSGEPMDALIATAVREAEIDFYQTIGERDGKDWYMAFHHVAESRSNLVLMIPAEEVLRPLHRLMKEAILVSASLILLLTSVLFLMVRKISQPVYALTDAALKVVKEDEYHDHVEVTSNDELGRLTEAFNYMMSGLRQRDFIRDTFGRYVTREIVTELIDNPEGLRLGGEKREVTILFCDIRGFTPLSEQIGPEQVVDLLNRYLGTMSTVVEKYGGTISEFIGDSVLAFFGAPVKHHDSPTRAVACGVAMQRAIKEINTENASRGLPSIGMGVGINTGAVIVGNIGSERRAKYGAVGHAINLAARVEAATVGGQILATEATYRRAKKNTITKKVSAYRLKGVTEAIKLYDVIGIRFPNEMMIPEVERALHPLLAPIPVRVTCIQDKQEAESVIVGQLTHYSEENIRITIGQRILPPSEIRIHFGTEGIDAEANLYGRVVDSIQSTDGFEHRLRVSYISPEARSLLQREQKRI